jgi:signal transduction histidine kinase
MIKTQSQRIVAISNYVLFAIVALRAVLSYGSSPEFAPLLILLAIFLLLLVTKPNLSLHWSAYGWIYFAIQTTLVVVMALLAPTFDFLWGLYIILANQAYLDLPRRPALIWVSGWIVIAGLCLMTALGAALGLAILLNFIAVSIFMISFVHASWQAEEARNESAALLRDLQSAHAQLQDYADRAEELSALRERNRVARELHDSVNQSIFSITLTAEAARTMLDRDPARVPLYLSQLQEMANSALAQLRSLIGQLRSKSDRPPAQ